METEPSFAELGFLTMSPTKPVAAFFDLDKTIIATSSAFAFGKEFRNNGMITRQEAWDLYLTKAQYMLVGQSSEKMDATRDSLAQLVKGWSVEDIQRITQETMRTVVTPAIYAEARELIDDHRAQGHDVIIISASASILVEPIAKELGVDTVVATELAEEDGKLTGEITRYLKGGAKAEAVRQFGGEAAEGLAFGIDDVPAALDLAQRAQAGPHRRPPHRRRRAATPGRWGRCRSPEDGSCWTWLRFRPWNPGLAIPCRPTIQIGRAHV